MKKKLILPAVAGMALMMAGCPKEQSAVVEEEELDVNIVQSPTDIKILEETSKMISLELRKDTLDVVPAMLHLVISNVSSEVVNTDSNYELSMLKDGVWVPIDLSKLYFYQVKHVINTMAVVSFDVEMFPKEIDYKKGTYKITKLLGNKRGSFIKEVEFTVK